MPRALWMLPPLAVFALVGCGPKPAPVPADEQSTPVLMVPDPVKSDDPKPVATDTPKSAELPVTLPSDLGGKAVAKALAPTRGGVIDAMPVTKAPRPRVSDLDRGEVKSPEKFAVRLPADVNPAGKLSLPSPPPERSPADLGQAGAESVAGLKMKEWPKAKAPSALSGAADVPMMARPLPDRASVEDPTVDLSAVKVIHTPLPVPTEPLPSLKPTIPDPFEFKDQLKGKLPREKEFADAPEKVSPVPYTPPVKK